MSEMVTSERVRKFHHCTLKIISQFLFKKQSKFFSNNFCLFICKAFYLSSTGMRCIMSHREEHLRQRKGVKYLAIESKNQRILVKLSRIIIQQIHCYGLKNADPRKISNVYLKTLNFIVN